MIDLFVTKFFVACTFSLFLISRIRLRRCKYIYIISKLIRTGLIKIIML